MPLVGNLKSGKWRLAEVKESAAAGQMGPTGVGPTGPGIRSTNAPSAKHPKAKTKTGK